jgi:NAD(P)-dependent dehydrogenase (short-subunit alcohol dehydrogenase family)
MDLAVITGATRGIGRAIAGRLAGEGFAIFALARDQAALASLAREISCETLACDLTSPSAPQALLDKLSGRVPFALVNNAGMAESAPLKATDDALITRHLELNFMAPMRLMRALAPLMAGAGRGRVVNVCSTAALTGYPYVSAYCASKHALLGATRSLAREFASKGLTFNAICPGYVRTEMFGRTVANIAQKTGRSEAEAEKHLASLSPQQRVFEPEEVAQAVTYLLSPAASGINGQALSIDGGEVEH